MGDSVKLTERRRVTMAAILMAFDDIDKGETITMGLDHGIKLVRAGREAVHSGDCIRQPWTCLRCCADHYLSHADDAIAALTKDRPDAR